MNLTNNTLIETSSDSVLKVMVGDVVAFKAESYYAPPPENGDAGTISQLVTSQLLEAFASGLAGAGKAGITGTELLSNTDLADAAEEFLTDPNRDVNDEVPRAYLNYMLFDEQLNSLEGGFDKVDLASGNGYKLHTEFFTSPVEVTKNGYLYIYTSNESDLKVLFDNLQITHQKGRLLEETHY